MAPTTTSAPPLTDHESHLSRLTVLGSANHTPNVMQATIEYIAASTNRYSQAAAISESSLVAFGSSNLIALWNINDDRGTFESIPGHEGVVTCIRFMSGEAFASVDDKGSLFLWRLIKSKWKMTSHVHVHKTAVSTLCIFDQWIVTGSSDGSIKIWKLISEANGSDVISEEQSLHLGRAYPLALAMAFLPCTKAAVLAIGGTDRNIHVWVRSELGFIHACLLSGHEDWVKCLDFLAPNPNVGSVTLASGSQDATVRLWHIVPWKKESVALQSSADNLSDELLDSFESSLGDIGDAEEGGRQISLRRSILTIKNHDGGSCQFSITFDALLVGHESGVTSLSWRPPGHPANYPTLLSTSTDSSVMLWSPSSASSSVSLKSIWINRQRFGDIGGQRLGGFVGGVWANVGRDALAWGWGGSWRRWLCTPFPESPEEERWTEISAIGGHCGPVKGLDWSPTGSYLISSGFDQTTRIHSALPSLDRRSTWHEISRPQIHGYDLLDAAFIDPLKFVSIADEKVVRVFEAPSSFVELVESLKIAEFPASERKRPSAASVPPLGLSNKATTDEAHGNSVVCRQRRPFEGELASATLWPEVDKIFGHGYESMTLTVSSRQRYFATACKATTAEHAVVRIYSTEDYKPVGRPLQGHSLTVTRVAFSPDERLVVSVSRDRSWRLYAKVNDEFVPVACNKSHGRIIWDCAWAAECDIFATASRDKTVKIWAQGNDRLWNEVETIKLFSSATAVAFSAGNSSTRRRLAVGLESGEIFIYTNLHNSATGWRCENSLPPRFGHASQIHRLAWQPSLGISTLLASCSDDGTLKILNLPIVKNDSDSVDYM